MGALFLLPPTHQGHPLPGKLLSWLHSLNLCFMASWFIYTRGICTRGWATPRKSLAGEGKFLLKTWGKCPIILKSFMCLSVTNCCPTTGFLTLNHSGAVLHMQVYASENKGEKIPLFYPMLPSHLPYLQSNSGLNVPKNRDISWNREKNKIN